MTKLDSLPERALELFNQVGDGLKQAIPNGAGKWLETGAKLGALKTGTRVATTFIRRNPAVAVAAAGAGLLWYVAWRKAKQAENGAIEGSATRVEARRVNGGSSRRSTGKRSSRSRVRATS